MHAPWLDRFRQGTSSLLAGVALWAVAAGCTSIDRLVHGPQEACGAYAAPNTVTFAATLSRTRDYRLWVPRMPERAELAIDDPSRVVVFSGPGRDVEINGGRLPDGDRTEGSRLQNVCFVFADGRTSLYRNIEVTGIAP